MLKVIARIFDENQLVGYLLTNGKVEKPVTREQAWKYAKNKMIENVVAVGSANVQTPFGASNSASISGKNGFELKTLPKIEEVCNSNEIFEMKEELRDNGAGYTVEERELLIKVLVKIRKAMSQTKLNAMKSAMKEAIYDKPNFHDGYMSMCQYVTVVATLYDGKVEEINERIQSDLEKKRNIIGYRIKYTGPNYLSIKRNPKAKDSIPYVTELKTNEECNLNFMETTQLAFDKKFNLTFANGKLMASAKKTRTLEEQLESYRVKFDNEVPELDIRTLETKENIKIIFNTLGYLGNTLEELKKQRGVMDYASSYILKLSGYYIDDPEKREKAIKYLEEVLKEENVNPEDEGVKQNNKSSDDKNKLNKSDQTPQNILDFLKRFC